MVLVWASSSCSGILCWQVTRGWTLYCCHCFVCFPLTYLYIEIFTVTDQFLFFDIIIFCKCINDFNCIYRSGKNVGVSSASDISLLLLALTCISAIAKLGPSKVSCSQFFSMITEITGSLMDMLVGLIPVSQAYNSIKNIGLHREFLVHFGPRASSCRAKEKWGSEEVVFWVNLAQRQLQQAIDKEKIWSRLTTSESIEVSYLQFRRVLAFVHSREVMLD